MFSVESGSFILLPPPTDLEKTTCKYLNAHVSPCFLAPAMEWNTTEIVFSGSGTGLNQINEPYSIFIPPTENALYIADNGNNRILRWPLNASAAKVVAGGQGPGSNATQLDSPRAVYVTKNGSILVSDLGNHRAQYFVNGSLVGRRVAGDGTPGSANTQIGLAIGGIAMDLNDNVYISEYDNSRVAKWAPNATYGTLAAGDGSPGNAPSQLSDPTGLYLDPISNILYIASQGGHCIMKWLPGASTGSTVAGTCGVSGNTTTLLTAPRCVTFDKYGNMYVADMSDSGRIITFPPNSMIGRPIITSGLSNPMAVALDEKLNLYVADYGHDRIVKYELL